MLTADTFHAALPLTAPPGSISPTVGEWLAGGGREHCLLCKAPLFLSFASFFISSSPTPIPLSSHTWFLQEPSSDNTLPPTRNHLLPHDKHAHAAITPQENALASSGCAAHLIREKHQHLGVATTCNRHDKIIIKNTTIWVNSTCRDIQD